MPHENTLDAKRTALAVIDVQEAFRRHIPDFAEVAARCALVAHAAHLPGVPGVVPAEKPASSSGGAQAFGARLEAAGARQVLLCGIEAHVCVNQTAHDLLARGYQVHLLTDCVSSRAEQNRRVGLDKMFRSGALPSSIELALFELMRDARHEQFKAIQKLIK